MAQDYGGLIPESMDAIRVCNADCPFGPKQLRYQDPPAFSWQSNRRNLSGDFCSIDGGMAVSEDTFAKLSGECGMPDIFLEEITILASPSGAFPKHPFFRVRSRIRPDFIDNDDVKLVSCPRCGRRRISLNLDRVDGLSAQFVDGKYVPLHIRNRKPGGGFVLRPGAVPGKSIFEIGPFLFATEIAKQEMERLRFTNLEFSEYGEVLPA